MKRIILSLFGFLLVSTFTGCIDLFETIVFADNGGGHVQQKLDMSQMAEMMESLKGMDKDKKEEKEESPTAAGDEMIKDWERLKEIEGITNVRIKQDTVKMIYTVDYDFANEAALNKAIDKKESSAGKQEGLYSFSKSSISRGETTNLGNLTESEDEEMADMLKSVMSEMKFHLSISVPGTIKSVSNNKAEISEDKKTITLVASFQNMADKETSLGMKISYKN